MEGLLPVAVRVDFTQNFDDRWQRKEHWTVTPAEKFIFIRLFFL